MFYLGQPNTFRGEIPTIKNVVMFSDARSGYKTTHYILGMRNMFDKSGISVFRWHFNASGEGEISTTDGQNTAVKAQREMEKKGRYVPACTTTEV